GTRFAANAGGKGANQAVAAARLGAQVTLLGRVGSDSFGGELRARLEVEGVATRWVQQTPGVASGIAAITVCDADNAILVVPGANACLSAADLDAAESAFAEVDVVLAQLEVPLATVEHGAELAARYRKPFVLNPAPAVRLPESLLARCTLITPNEYELATAFAQPDPGWRELLTRLPGRVVVTRGSEGAYFTDSSGVLQHQPAFPVKAVDTTGAGDTFNGALGAFWNLGLAEAVRRGCAAGALSVTQRGAQDSMPRLAELNLFLDGAA
ncbi:MAG TPA: ribokinase, partial [Acetobacteraceae bacterium]|nr:ribokinase [Acetobacteraceae bacterium]